MTKEGKEGMTGRDEDPGERSTSEPAVMEAGVLRIGADRKYLRRWRKRGQSS